MKEIYSKLYLNVWDECETMLYFDFSQLMSNFIDMTFGNHCDCLRQIRKI